MNNEVKLSDKFYNILKKFDFTIDESLFFVEENEQIKPFYLESSIPLDEILSNASSINEKLKKYSTNLFENGIFWENNKNKFSLE